MEHHFIRLCRCLSRSSGRFCNPEMYEVAKYILVTKQLPPQVTWKSTSQAHNTLKPQPAAACIFKRIEKIGNALVWTFFHLSGKHVFRSEMGFQSKLRYKFPFFVARGAGNHCPYSWNRRNLMIAIVIIIPIILIHKIFSACWRNLSRWNNYVGGVENHGTCCSKRFQFTGVK